MALSWSRLAPHRPLKAGDPLHVRRPQGGADELAARLLTGAVDVVAVVGPVGSGKSTELAQAAQLLQRDFVVVQVPLDRLLDMRKVTEDQVFERVAVQIMDVAQASLGIALSPGSEEPRDHLLGAIREITERSSQGSLVLLLDGLEKCDAETALRVVRALLEVRDEARVVFVAPYSLVVGSGGYDLHASGAHFHVVRAVPVRPDQQPESNDGRAFLRAVALLRLGLPWQHPINHLEAVLATAAEMSGGLPRAFLQLVQAAGSYAALSGNEVPTLADLHAAAGDQAESLARLLERGDVERLADADGRSERELPVADRVRLLMQGLLLEYKTSARGTVVHPAPLLHGLLGGPAS
jgi:hypothetical protein